MGNPDFGSGGTVPKQAGSALQDVENEIKSLEKELSKAESDFRKASVDGDVKGMVQSHNRVCQIVAGLSALWAGAGQPTVFVNHFQNSSAAPRAVNMPATSLPEVHVQPSDKIAPPPPEPVVDTPAAAEPPADDYSSDFDGEGHQTVAQLEVRIAALAMQMQKCLEAGDMDGMLKCNEEMGILSEMIARQESKTHAQPESSGGPKSLSGSWSTGDTLAIARQRAEERKKQIQKTEDSFETVVSDQVAQAEPAAEQQPKVEADIERASEKLREQLEGYTFYEILSVPQTASFEELHKNYFRKVRKLHKRYSSKEFEFWQFQELVNILSLAHDVLKVPNVRLQYDMGPESQSGTTGEVSKLKLMPLKELLKFSTLIPARDLATAIEATQGQNEREVGYFLIEKELLSEEEFDSILFGQKLVSAGKLTVAQFELAMQEMRDSSIPFFDTLVASEWLQPSDILSGDLLG